MSLTIEKSGGIKIFSKNIFFYYGRYFLTLILLFVFFSIMSNSIIDIKLLELKFYVNKEQLLNYELSSKILREKIKNILISKDDYVAELKNNILESAVMNSQISSEELSISFSERVGLIVVNLVRLISLNERLTFIEDRNIMYQIQYAFFMERTKKFPAAIKKYEEISLKLKNSNSYENGFVLLHLGYCYAMAGSTNSALQKLYKTEEIFTGSQFGDYARILINVLIENDKRTKEIDRLPIPLSEKANLYYENGRYSETVSALDKIENRNSEQNFVRARSLEELGNVNAAAGEYVKIVEKKDNPSVAIKANRRIMMIGSIYENNEDLKEYSKQNAQTLGDTEFIKTVESGSTLIKSNVIIEKISSSEDPLKEIDAVEANQIAELKNEFQTFTIERKKEISETASLVSKIIKERKFVNIPNLRVVLIDGRVLYGDWIEISSGFLTLNSAQFPISLPIANIFEISMESNKFSSDFSMRIEESSKIYSGISKISIDSFKWTAFKESESIPLKETSNYEIKIEESKKEE
jgi:tetratricopeptide (TPR) repeat protein